MTRRAAPRWAGVLPAAPGAPPRTTRDEPRRAASICRFVIQAASEACRPNSPNARSAPWVATPVRRPRWSLRYLTRAGSNISYSFFFVARGARGVFGAAGFSVLVAAVLVARARVARFGVGGSAA